MGVLEQRIRKVTNDLTDVINNLVSKDAGIPRPIIGLNNEMPFYLPVRQQSVNELRKIARDTKEEFDPATLIFIVHPNQDPRGKRMTQIAYPYEELTRGEIIEGVEDQSEVKLVQVAVKDIPPDWRSERPLDLIIQARSPNKRYGEALAVAKTINLRVPRMAIPGKETGI